MLAEQAVVTQWFNLCLIFQSHVFKCHRCHIHTLGSMSMGLQLSCTLHRLNLQMFWLICYFTLCISTVYCKYAPHSIVLPTEINSKPHYPPLLLHHHHHHFCRVWCRKSYVSKCQTKWSKSILFHFTSEAKEFAGTFNICRTIKCRHWNAYPFLHLCASNPAGKFN